MKITTWAVSAGATVLTAVFLMTGATVAAAVPAVDPQPSVTCEIGNVWSRLPADLRADIRELKDLEPGEGRAEAARLIRDGALDGTYGAGVQKRAERVKEHGVRSLARPWVLNNCG